MYSPYPRTLASLGGCSGCRLNHVSLLGVVTPYHLSLHFMIFGLVQSQLLPSHWRLCFCCSPVRIWIGTWSNKGGPDSGFSIKSNLVVQKVGTHLYIIRNGNNFMEFLLSRFTVWTTPSFESFQWDLKTFLFCKSSEFFAFSKTSDFYRPLVAVALLFTCKLIVW